MSPHVFPEISWKKLKLSLGSPRRLSCVGTQTRFSSPLNYVLESNQFNYLSRFQTLLQNVHMKDGEQNQSCVSAKTQIQLVFPPRKGAGKDGSLSRLKIIHVGRYGDTWLHPWQPLKKKKSLKLLLFLQTRTPTGPSEEFP